MFWCSCLVNHSQQSRIAMITQWKESGSITVMCIKVQLFKAEIRNVELMKLIFLLKFTKKWSRDNPGSYPLPALVLPPSLRKVHLGKEYLKTLTLSRRYTFYLETMSGKTKNSRSWSRWMTSNALLLGPICSINGEVGSHSSVVVMKMASRETGWSFKTPIQAIYHSAVSKSTAIMKPPHTMVNLIMMIIIMRMMNSTGMITWMTTTMRMTDMTIMMTSATNPKINLEKWEKSTMTWKDRIKTLETSFKS